MKKDPSFWILEARTAKSLNRCLFECLMSFLGIPDLHAQESAIFLDEQQVRATGRADRLILCSGMCLRTALAIPCETLGIGQIPPGGTDYDHSKYCHTHFWAAQFLSAPCDVSIKTSWADCKEGQTVPAHCVSPNLSCR